MKLNLVPARTGIMWVKLGMQTFWRQPLALTSLFFLYFGAMLLLTQLPVVGPVLSGLLVPAATLGFMAATELAHRGKTPLPTVLLSAFRAGRQRARAILQLGLLYATASLVATLAGQWLGGGEPAGPAGSAAMQFSSAVLLSLALHLPIFILFWHAPALVHWHGVAPVKSLFFSAVACFRNIGALSLFGLAWFLVLTLVGAAISILGSLVAGPTAGRLIMVPLLLAMGAMFTTSFYFTFRDSFQGTGADDPPPTGAMP